MIVHALDALGLLFGAAHCWQKHRRQDPDDSDDDEKFDEGEGELRFAIDDLGFHKRSS